MIKKIFYLILITLKLSSCVGDFDKKSQIESGHALPTSPIQVTKIDFKNNQFKISGKDLAGVVLVKIKRNDSEKKLKIVKVSPTEIIAEAKEAFSLVSNNVFDFLISTASATTTYQIIFTPDNNSITAGMLTSMGASAGQVLKYNGTNWVPTSLSNSQTYLGTWNATTNVPDISNLGLFQAGDYYIVSTAGTYNSITYHAGDWAMFNGSSFEKIDNSSNVVSTFNGRVGAVTPQSGDYTWSQITKTGSKIQDIADVDITGRNDGDVLLWSAGSNKWVSSTYSTTPADGTVTYSKLSLNDGDIPQSKVNGLVTALSGKEAAVTAGTTSQYYRGDKSWQTLDTSAVAENTNLYFTNVRALGVPLTGLSVTNSAVVATDTVLQAMGKLQGQINNKSDSSTYIDWSTAGVQTLEPTRLNLTTANRVVETNASGVPTASSITSTELGYLSGVSSNIQTQLTAKQATIDKTTAQPVSKLRIYGANTTNYVELNATTLTGNRILTFPDSNGSSGNVLSTDGSGNLSWSNLATTAPVTSVNTQTGAVTLTTTNINEGTNLYYTTARVAADVLTSVLTGLSTATNAVIAATDSVLSAFGKLQAQINAHTTSIASKADQANVAQTITAATVTGLSAPVAGSDATNKTYVDGFGQWTKTGSDIYYSSGNVGIGTTLPSSLLHVQNSGATIDYLRFDRSNGGPSDFFVDKYGETVIRGGALPYGASLSVNAGSDSVKGVVVRSNSAAQSANLFEWQSNTGAVKGVISPSGNLGIGTNNPLIPLTINTTQGVAVQLETPGTSSTHQTGFGLVTKADGSTLGSASNKGWQVNARGDAFTGQANNFFAAFWNGASWITPFSITPAGYVGIGTTTPSQKLEVAGTSPAISIKDTAATWGGAFGAQIIGSDTNGAVYKIGIPASGTSLDLNTSYTSLPIAFKINNSEKMRVSTTGNVGVGTTTPGAQLDVSPTVTATADLKGMKSGLVYNGVSAMTNYYGHYIAAPTGTGTITNKYALVTESGAGNVGIGTTSPSYTLHVNGSVAGTSAYNNLSDERLKKDVVKIQNALEKILSLDGVFYNWRREEYPERKLSDRREMGVIAQKVEKYFPEAITKDEKGFRSVAYSMLIAPIIEAIREIKNWMDGTDKIIEAQQKEIASLKEQNKTILEFLCRKNPLENFCKKVKKTERGTP